MKTTQLFTLFSMLLAFSVADKLHAQSTTAGLPIIRATNTIETLSQRDIFANPGNMLPAMPMEKPVVLGDIYLNKNWNKVAVTLYSSEVLLEGYIAKYDLFNDDLDIFFPTGLRTIKGDRIKNFVWKDSVSGQVSHFINGKEFNNEENKFDGFFQVVTDGRASLLKQTKATVLYSNYNEVLQIGRRDHEIKHNTENYYYLDGQLKQVPKNEKNLLLVFGEHAPEMKKFIRSNELSFAKDHHLMAIFIHFNSLLK